MKNTLPRRHNIFFIILLIGGIWFYKSFFCLKKIRATVPYQLKYVEKVFGGSSKKEKLPMVIMLHGSGGNETDLLGLFSIININNLRVISFRAPFRYGFGYNWNKNIFGKSQAEVNKKFYTQVKNVGLSIADSVDELTRKYPTKGKPYMLGFSAGARMAYYVAVNHPEKFKAVFAISGILEPEFIPKDNYDGIIFPIIFAYHGTNDSLISIGSARNTINKIKDLTEEVFLKEFPVGHTISPRMLTDIEQRLREQIYQF